MTMKLVTDRPATADIQPRRAPHRSYGEIIRMLIAEATARVRSAKAPPLAPPTPSIEAKTIAKTLLKLKQQKNWLEARLRAMNLQEDNGKLDWTWQYKNASNEKPSARRQRQTSRLQQYRVRATLDTIDMTPKQAKAYFLNLERQLQKV